MIYRPLYLLLFCTLLFSESGFAQNKKKAKQKTKVALSSQKQSKSKKTIKPYKEVITSKAISQKGLLTTHKVDDTHYFEIADSLLEREILVISRISGTIQGFNFGGAGMKARGQQVWRWQKKDNKLLLRSVSYNNIASKDKPIYRSVRNNNFEPIVVALDIKAIGPDSSSYVVDMKELFTKDVPMIGPLNSQQRKNFGVKGLDGKRSMVMWTKSFPLNTEVRHILTFNASKLPSNANTQSLSVEMNQSMVLLPEEIMEPRLYDERVGFFSVTQTDYGLDEQKAKTRRFITRWKLEPKDEAAYRRGELVEPITPIVYYIDPATPVKWRKYLKQGVNDWQVAFEAAGFKNAIYAKDAPSPAEDPDWSPEDVRYSVIRYTANPIQNAMGPHVHDPRSGQILESDIIWYHNVMNLLRNWYFIQTSAVNEKARGTKFEDEIMGRLIRFVSAHEVGHTLGFPHNMGASHAYPVDSLRSASFTERMGTAPSIMDYARFNYVAQPGDDAHLFPNIGIYDKWAVKWGYSKLYDSPDQNAKTEKLHEWIRSHEKDPLYWYGRQTFNTADPRAQTEDLGDDAMKAGGYGLKNLALTTANLVKWTSEQGRNYEDLKELYEQIVSQWNRYSNHVRVNVGGIHETYKTYDQEGAVYSAVPKETQQRAMQWLQEHTFGTPKWLLQEDVVRKIEGTGTLNRIGQVQSGVLDRILSTNTLGRLIESEANYGNKTYTLLEMMNALRNGIWSELRNGAEIDVYRRNLQRAYIERLGFLMSTEQKPAAGNASPFFNTSSIDISRSDIRPVVRADLKRLRGQIRNGLIKTQHRLSRYHLEDAMERIDLILKPKG